MTADPRFDGPGPDAVWLAAAAEGDFTIQRCDDCNAHQFPPSVLCRHCGSHRIAFVAASGRATVYSRTTVRRRDGAYNVAIVELVEGPRMMSSVEDVEPDAVRIGDELVADIVTRPVGGEERPVIVFRLRKDDRR